MRQEPPAAYAILMEAAALAAISRRPSGDRELEYHVATLVADPLEGQRGAGDVL